MLAVIDDIAARLAPEDPQSARVKMLSVFAMMVGTLQLSRSLADRQLADAVLEQGLQNALALLGPERQSRALARTRRVTIVRGGSGDARRPNKHPTGGGHQTSCEPLGLRV